MLTYNCRTSNLILGVMPCIDLRICIIVFYALICEPVKKNVCVGIVFTLLDYKAFIFPPMFHEKLRCPKIENHILV